MDRFSNIVAFVRVAELGSFVKAGVELGMTGSAVSKSVARLEARLGMRLLNRSTRSVSVTPDGEEFRDRCTQIILELDEAEQAIARRADSPGGLLRVDFPVSLGRKLAGALGKFAADYPKLIVQASFHDEVFDIIEKGFDAVVRIGWPRDSHLIVKRVGIVRYVVCASPEYIESHPSIQTPDDLMTHNCIRRLPFDGLPAVPWKFAKSESGELYGMEVQGTLCLSSNDAMVDAAIAGGGPVQLHSYMAEPEIQAGRLCQVLERYAVNGPPISVVYPTKKQLTPKVRAFVDFMSGALDIYNIGDPMPSPPTTAVLQRLGGVNLGI